VIDLLQSIERIEWALFPKLNKFIGQGIDGSVEILVYIIIFIGLVMWKLGLLGEG
jgi:hypothetical protein